MNSKLVFLLMLGLTAALADGAPSAAAQRHDASAAGQEHREEGDHDDESGEHAEEGGEVTLTDAQVKLGEIRSVAASTGEIGTELRLNGTVSLNQDRVAEIVPRVPGAVREVRAQLGDEVRAGDVLAVVQSRELADAAAEFLAARERLALAQDRFAREADLRAKRISAEQEFLEAKQALAEARIEQRSAEQKLRALGFSSDELQALLQRSDDALTRYSVTAPFAGTVIEKHVAQGEQVDTGTAIFRIAQLDKVWVIASVYPKDLGRVAVGQLASVTVQAYPDRAFSGKVTWIASTIDERTRTLPIRVEIDNRERLLKPGLFARVAVVTGARKNALVIPLPAVQRQKGEDVVFVEEGQGRYARREVTLGVRSGGAVEVIAGLNEGERVVTDGAFLLKSEIEKAGFEAGHGH